jgi:hypothetical protein
MPLSGASGQAPAAPAAKREQAIAEVAGSFVIRSTPAPKASPPAVKVGSSIRIDRALVARRTPTRSAHQHGDTHETR